MRSAEDRKNEENQLRHEHQQLVNELSELSEGDSRHQDVSDRLRLKVIKLRQIINDEHMGLCPVPDCITRPTVTVGDDRWCETHAPQKK